VPIPSHLPPSSTPSKRVVDRTRTLFIFFVVVAFYCYYCCNCCFSHWDSSRYCSFLLYHSLFSLFEERGGRIERRVVRRHPFRCSRCCPFFFLLLLLLLSNAITWCCCSQRSAKHPTGEGAPFFFSYEWCLFLCIFRHSLPLSLSSSLPPLPLSPLFGPLLRGMCVCVGGGGLSCGVNHSTPPSAKTFLCVCFPL
jgi:hypothetical protein